MKLNSVRLTIAFMIGVGVILLVAGLWTGLQRRYQATARIKVIGDKWRSEPRWTGKEPPGELLVHVAEIKGSLAVVVESLPLTGELAGLTPAQALTQLEENLQVNLVPGTSLIEIKVASRAPEAAAQIANQLAAISGNHTRHLVVESATTPTHREFPNLMPAFKLIAPALFLLVAGLFILFDLRRVPQIQPA